MVEFLQALIDGLLQGLTEFLPISSSAHLYLAQLWTEVIDDPLSRIVIVHLGTLLGAACAVRQQLLAWWAGFMAPSALSQADSGKLGHLLIASIPVLLVGAALQSHVASLYTIAIVGSTTLIFGLLLAYVLYTNRGKREWQNLDKVDALLVGLAQVLALIPGVSRSGICLTALLARGLHPAAAARFTVLMALPVLLAVVVWLGWRWLSAPEMVRPFTDLLAGVIAAVSGWAVVRYGLPYLERSPQGTLLWVCIAWRILLGSTLLALVWLGVLS